MFLIPTHNSPIMTIHSSLDLEKIELSIMEQAFLYSPLLIYAALVLVKGTPGPNKYGPPPEYYSKPH